VLHARRLSHLRLPVRAASAVSHNVDVSRASGAAAARRAGESCRPGIPVDGHLIGIAKGPHSAPGVSVRVLLVAASASLALAAPIAAAADSSAMLWLKSPRLAEIARARAAIPDVLLHSPSARAFAPSGFWGGDYRTSAGETVTVYASNSYSVDPALGQRWADFLAWLLHGSEISSVTVLLATLDQIKRICGGFAVACYDARGGLLYAPGEDPNSDFSAEAVITHEYGHHVAAHRSNAPWSALDWGPKRWASSMRVCANARAGRLAPGAEDPISYGINPGEGWAETYRVLNERRLGVAEPPWQIVSDSLYPDDAALTAAEQDVTTPWQTQTTTTQTASLTPTTPARTYTIATPLDGSLKVDVKASQGLRLTLDVYASGRHVIHTAAARANARTTTICGARSYTIRVRASRRSGSFLLTLTEP
jgi:hypothetical protein